MCGVFAAILPKGFAECPSAGRAVELMHHRGPDAHGVLHVELEQLSVTLGMSRLKIVDQSDLAVPYDFRENLGVALAYNGEVYDWRSQRLELHEVPRGGWMTRCDAEVLAAAWRRWGTDCLSHLNGMWGIVLVDTWDHRVFVARDRAGEKPLYWSDGVCLGERVRYYASEIKALPVALRPVECLDAVTLEFDASEETPFDGVFAVPPGTSLRYIRGRDLPQRTRWWALPRGEQEPPKDSIADDLAELLYDAVRIRRVAEVPVAVQLSGGLDSAIVQAVCDHDQLYCVDFSDDGVDNASRARLAAWGHEVTPVTFTRDDLVEALPSVAYHLDTPATWTAVCQWFVNQKIAADGSVIVMAGEGADELFGGYTRYRILYWLERLGADELLASYRPLIRRVIGDTDHVLAHMLDRSGDPHGVLHALDLVNEYGGERGSMLDRMMSTDFYTTMQVLVRMADRMAAAFSLENRSPFFDYRLMEFAARLPDYMKVTEDASKWLLRQAAARLGVHERIVGEKTKRGLYVPKTWGTGGVDWDRRWFARLMDEAWRSRCCRDAFCTEGEPS